MSRIPDQKQRDEIVRERQRNVVVNAGAGTGKTYTLVSRIIEMIAPSDPALTPVELHRIAAITFTRRAAGDLKLQVRRRLLDAFASEKADSRRRNLIERALPQLDSAFIGTIHGFCRRLLLSRPMESGLGPGMDLVDDATTLRKDTHRLLLHHVQTGTLADALPELSPETHAEVQETLTWAMDSGILTASKQRGPHTDLGLDALFDEMIYHRDTTLLPGNTPAPAREATDRLVRLVSEIGIAVDSMDGREWSIAVLKRFHRMLAEIDANSPAQNVFQSLTQALSLVSGLPKTKSNAAYPQDDDRPWSLVKALRNDPFKSEKKLFANRMLANELTSDFHGWMAARLLRTQPAVVALYERLKRSDGLLDQTDLLLKLRNALRDISDKSFREHCQGLFDHILIDECQDTDPLQMEIVAFLAEDGARASEWRNVRLRSGALTVVGDPKQSIYRFRRADIRAYDEFLELMGRNNPLIRSLSCNFRSRRELILEVFNQRGPALLGAPENPPEVGRAPYENLQPFEGIPASGAPVVHKLLFGPEATTKKDEIRSQEGKVVADYLSKLLDPSSLFRIRDMDTGLDRKPALSDVAILCRTTTKLNFVTDALNRRSLPYVQRGGTTALRDPLIARFLLALRAVSDPGDGPAWIACQGPPFFSSDLEAVINKTEPATTARKLLEELHDLRHSLPLSTIAGRLLEESGFGAYLAVAPNGQQRLNTLLQVIGYLQSQADAEGLDFDQATERARGWLVAPPKFDPAESDYVDAIRIFTTHQSKGLEFPVVVLWDSTSSRSPQRDSRALIPGRDGISWRMQLKGLTVDSPAGNPATEEETQQALEEDRLYYVAATRARDHLVIPVSRGPIRGSKALYHRLLTEDLPESAMVTVGYPEDAGTIEPARAPDRLEKDTTIESRILEAERLIAESIETGRHPDRQPIAASKLAHPEERETGTRILLISRHEEDVGDAEEPEEEKDTEEKGRFGATFGSLVHRTLELYFAGLGLDDAIKTAQDKWRVEEKEDARRDVENAIRKTEEMLTRGAQRLPEYNLAYLRDGNDGTYIVGAQLDLVLVSSDEVTIIDFKTDRAPKNEANHKYPAYENQLRIYGEAIQNSGLLAGRQLKLKLLFTENGLVQEVGP